MTRRSSFCLAFALVSAGLTLVRPPLATAVPPGYAVQLVHAGLASPVAIGFAPDGRLFHLERSTGRILVYPSALSPTSTVWATLSVNSSMERGLLGMAFHPSFPDSPYVYFYHTNVSPAVNRVVRLRDSGGIGVDRAVIFDGLPAASPYHHSGRLAFGPDRMLYVTFGDQTDPQYAPNANDVRGKILRLTPLGQVPADNPFGATNPAYAKGVRNPFGLTFDPVTGRGYFTENGPDCDDEVNQLVRGADYGWNATDPCGGQPSGHTAMRVFTPTIAPTGCVVYRSAQNPAFDGNLFLGSYNEGAVMRVIFDPNDPARIASLDPTFITVPGELVVDVTMGPDGQLWFSTMTGIYRMLTLSLVDVGRTPEMVGFVTRPNPFAGSISVTLPSGVRAVRLEIIDVLGRRVRSWSGPLTGTLTWDGRDDTGVSTPTGVYFARLTTATGVASRRMVRITP